LRWTHYTKRDANHVEIRDGLRALGAVVWDTADLGGEVLDLIVFWRGQVVAVEVKNPDSRWKLTESQAKAIVALQDVGCTVVVAEYVEDVLVALT
jgi:hypothetical protein